MYTLELVSKKRDLIASFKFETRAEALRVGKEYMEQGIDVRIRFLKPEEFYLKERKEGR